MIFHGFFVFIRFFCHVFLWIFLNLARFAKSVNFVFIKKCY